MHAWKVVQSSHPDWDLDVVGKGEVSYVNHLRIKSKDLELERFKLLDPVYGLEK